MCSFQPWSTGLLSTSWDIDAKRPSLSKAGEWVASGNIVIIPLLEPTPFGVARVTNCDTEGNLQLQWLANEDNDPKGTFLPGWTPPGKVLPYYSLTRRADIDVPYMAATDNIHMNQREVVLHSFTLEEDNTLPNALLKELSVNDSIWWEIKTPISPAPK